jgi:glycosyltransferase involved in cell wall biosynthesis
LIVFLHGAPAFGAVETYVLDLLHGLGDRAGAIVYPDVPALEPFAAAPLVEHVRLPEAVAAGSTLRLIARLTRTLRRLRPDVAHVTDVWPAAMVAAWLARVPRVIVTHHTPELPRRDNLPGRLWWKLAWLTRPEVVYTSESDRQSDRRSGTTHVVYYGIDLDRWLDAPHAIDHAGPIIGTAARLVEQKGLALLVEAAPTILTRYPSTLFVIVGDGDQRSHLEQLVHNAGLSESFVFTGMRHDVERYVSSFDIYALPSYFEGLCYAVIEAQAAGVPVIATPVGGVAENVVDGVTGKRMAVGDAASLADGILWMLDNPARARELGAEARRRAIERYSRRRMVAESVALYD